MSPDGHDITELLLKATDGNQEALAQLMPVVYDELYSMARRHRIGERPDHTLNTTALVHEAYMKLVRLDRIQWQNRAQFFAIASQAMRRVLINYAKKKKAAKRGGKAPHVSVDDVDVISHQRAEELLALDEALERLSELNDRQHRVVECRFFGGLTVEETAEALDISPATVKRDWALARAWLNRELSSER